VKIRRHCGQCKENSRLWRDLVSSDVDKPHTGVPVHINHHETSEDATTNDRNVGHLASSKRAVRFRIIRESTYRVKGLILREMRSDLPPFIVCGRVFPCFEQVVEPQLDRVH